LPFYNGLLKKIRSIYEEKDYEHFKKKKDNLVGLFFDVFSIPIVRLMKKLNLRIHPNVITIISFIFAIFASFFFFNDKLAVGAFCFFCHILFDAVDGKWSRLTSKVSRIGEKLDYYNHVFGNISMYFGLLYSQYCLSDNLLLGMCIIFAHYVIIVFMSLFITEPYYKTALPRIYTYYSPAEEGFFSFFIGPLFDIVYVCLPMSVTFSFISFVILFLRQKERPNVKDIKDRVRALLKI